MRPPRLRPRHHPPPTTPGLAIAGFILAFFLPFVGLILCAASLPECSRRRRGEGLAWAGIIIGGLTTLLVAAAMQSG